MPLDIRTLLVAVAMATVCCAAARFLLWRMHPHVPGLAHWVWACVLGAGALLLFAGHGAVPDILSLSLSQVLIASGFLLAWDGFRRFLGRKNLPAWLVGILAVGALLPLPLSIFEPSLALRALANAVVVATISALIARELLTTAPRHGTASHATAYIYIINSLVFLGRAAAALTSDTITAQPYGFAVTLLWWLCATVAVTLGMTLMTAERLQQNLDNQARRDPLTGALNRRAFSADADKELARARRNGRPLSVLMMDLDHFKRINDQLGHATGDDILCRFVAVSDRMLRAEDIFCRFGGEEFVALLSDTSADQAMAVAERLRTAYASEAATLPPATFAFTVSIGVGELQPGEELETTLRRADAALYLAKAAGRNRCELAPPLPSPHFAIAVPA